MKTFKALSVAVVAIAGGAMFTGCARIESSMVSQSQIYTSYTASYDESSATLSLSATFNVGDSLGTYVILDSPSSVSVNGQDLTESTDVIDQVSYVSQTYGMDGWQSPQVFVYTDDNGNVYVNSLFVPSPVEVTNPSGAVYSKSSGIYVGWTTPDSVRPNESLTAYIQSSGHGPLKATGTAHAYGTVGSAGLDPDEVAQLPDGDAQVYICRGNGGEAAETPGAGGTMSTSYCSAKVSVVLVP